MTDLPVAVTVTDAAGLTTSATATITIANVNTVNIGQTTIGTIADTQNGNVIIAQPVTLTQVGSLQSLSMYVKTVGGQLRLGLYSGATPTTLVAQTNAFTPVTGWNTQPVLTAINLPPAQYWFAFLSQLNTLVVEKVSAGSTAFFKTVTFGTMPATFPASPSTESSLWSIYGTFQVTPDTTPPSIPTNLTATNVS